MTLLKTTEPAMRPQVLLAIRYVLEQGGDAIAPATRELVVPAVLQLVDAAEQGVVEEAAGAAGPWRSMPMRELWPRLHSR